VPSDPPVCPSSFLFLLSPCVPHVLILVARSRFPAARIRAAFPLAVLLSNLPCTHARRHPQAHHHRHHSSSSDRPSPFSGSRLPLSLSLSISLSLLACVFLPLHGRSLSLPLSLSLSLSLSVYSQPVASLFPPSPRNTPTWHVAVWVHVARSHTRYTQWPDRPTATAPERLRMRSTHGAEGTDDSGRVHTTRRSALMPFRALARQIALSLIAIPRSPSDRSRPVSRVDRAIVRGRSLDSVSRSCPHRREKGFDLAARDMKPAQDPIVEEDRGKRLRARRELSCASATCL